MASLGNSAAAYIFEQGRLGQEERQASQLAQLKFEQARQKAQEESAAKRSLGAYLGGSLGQLAAQSPEMAGQAIKMQSEQQKMNLEQRSMMADQLAGLAQSFVAAPNPATYQKFVETYAQIDPQGQLPPYESLAQRPEVARNAANELMGLSQQLKLQKAQLDAQGTPGVHVPFSPDVQAQKVDLARQTAEARRAPGAAGGGGTVKAQSTVGKALVDREKYSPDSEEYKALTAVINRAVQGPGKTDGSTMTPSEQAKNRGIVRSIDGVLEAIGKYRRDVEEKGSEVSFGPWNAENTARQKTLYNLILTELKNAWEFGALQKAEFDFFSKLIQEPGTIYGAFKGADAALASIDQVIDNLKTKKRMFGAEKAEEVQKTSKLTEEQKKELEMLRGLQ